jgi:hypothetical protein
MALLAVEGVYENGKIELAEKPEGVEHARVVVTFLPDEQTVMAEAKERERKEAMERLFARMERGFDFGGGPYYANREELYEERLKRLDKSDG